MSGTTLRRLLHASTAGVVVLVPLASWTALRAVLVAVAVAAVAFEAIRLRATWVRAALERVLPVFRPTEARRPSGAMWLAVGYAAAALFPAPAPVAGILVSGLADPAASLVGSRGSTQQQKTLRGSAAHLAVAVAVLLALQFSWSTALIVGVLATVVERWSGSVDDNLAVAPAVCAALTLMT